MNRIRLRHVVRVNPGAPLFDRLSPYEELTFLPMEAVWADARLDLSRVRPKAAVSTGYTRFQNGDVLVPKITPTFEAGRSVLIDGLRNKAGAGTTELHVLRPGPSIDPRFLTYITQGHSFLKLGEAEMYGVAGQKRVPDDFIRDFEVTLPELSEQQRITDFLDAETRIIDRVRAARRRLIELLVLKRDRLVDELVSGGQNVSAFVPLKYLVSSVSVGIVITPAAWYVEADGVPALRGLNVKPGKIEFSDMVQISHEGHLLHRKSRLAAGDLVVVRTGQAGAAAVVPPELDGVNCIDLVIVRPGNSLISKFVEYLLNSSYAKRRVSEFSVGSIQAHFNVAAMKAMPVPNHSVAEQKRRVAAIEEVAQPIEQAMSKMREQDRLLVERRQALITAAVTGQIDVATARGVD